MSYLEGSEEHGRSVCAKKTFSRDTKGTEEYMAIK